MLKSGLRLNFLKGDDGMLSFVPMDQICSSCGLELNEGDPIENQWLANYVDIVSSVDLEIGKGKFMNPIVKQLFVYIFPFLS